jgi:hypothetical protein
MRNLLTHGLLVLLVVVSAACAEVPIPGDVNTPPPDTQTSGTETPAPSGIEGQTMMGPACPGPVQIDTPCPDTPVQATVTILDANTEQVAQVQSDLQGQFTVKLPPGTYTLQPEPLSVLQRAEPMTVTVVAGDFISVIITYDSGIR